MLDRDGNKMPILSNKQINDIADGVRSYCEADVEQLARRLLVEFKENAKLENLIRWAWNYTGHDGWNHSKMPQEMRNLFGSIIRPLGQKEGE